MDLKAYLRDKRALVDEALKSVFPSLRGLRQTWFGP